MSSAVETSRLERTAAVSLGSRHRFGVVLIGLVLVTAAVRLPDLSQPLWLDEVASMRIIHASDLGQLLRMVASGESTPPLWYLLGYGIHRVDLEIGIGHLIAVLRVFALLQSCLLTVAATVYARRLLPLPQAALAGALVAFGSLLVEHGTELRAYPLLALLSMLLMIAVDAAARRTTPLRVGCLALVATAGAFTHYFFFLTMSAAIVWLWTTKLSLRTRATCTTALLSPVVPFTLWVPHLREQMHAHRFGFIGSFDGHQLVTIWSSFFFQNVSLGRWHSDLHLLIVLLVGGGVVLLLSAPATRLCGLAAAVPFFAVAALWALGAEIFDPRNLIGVAPFAAIAIARATLILPRHAALVAVVVGIAALASAYTLTQAPLKRTSFTSVSAWLETHGWQSSDPVIFFGEHFWDINPVAWYLHGHPLLIRGRPKADHLCPVAFVVIENETGREWLAQQHATSRTDSISFYGNQLEGERQQLPILVARISTQADTLARAKQEGASLFFPAGTRPLCLNH